MAFTRPKAAQIDFDITNISDPLIRLNSAETGSADKDVGIVIERGDDTNVAFIYDESADEFVLVNTTETGTTSGNVTIASYANLQAGTINATAYEIGSTGLVFEGSTPDSNETTLTVTDPTADRTITLPDLTGTVSLITATETLTNKTLRAPTFESGSNAPEFLETRYVNATQMDFVQLYTGASSGSYFTQNEYQKVATITPGASAENYTFRLRMTATSASNYQIVEFTGALRSNTLPDLSFTSNYFEEHNGTRFIEPKLWTKETTTAGFILAFKYIHNANLYGGVNVEAQIIPRTDSQRANVSFNTTQNSEITSIDSGFTENDPTLIYANVSGTLEFGTQFRIEGSSADGNELTITATNPTADRTITFPDATGTVSLITATETLTNKTLTTPVISSISNTGTITLPTSTDTLVGRTTTDTLTNKTLTSPKINEDVAVTSTATELNIVDGNTSATSTTVADADRLVLNDNGTMVQVAVTDLNTYFQGNVAAGSNQQVQFNNSGALGGDDGLTYNSAGGADSNGLLTSQNISVTNRLSLGGSGAQFFAFNEDTVKVKFANWYSSNSRQYGQGQLWYELFFAAADDTDTANNRRIGFYLEEPNNGASDADDWSGSGAHPTNPTFFASIDAFSINYNNQLRLHEDATGQDIGTNYIALQQPSSLAANRTLTLPDATDTLIGRATTDTLTNKTLTSPSISGDTTFADGAFDFDIASHDGTNGLKLGGTLVTSNATELNLLDGVTGIALGTAGNILIVDSDGTGIASDTSLTIDTANNRLGINQTSPAVTLHMTGDGADSAQIRMEQHNSTADAPDIRTRKSRGTAASSTSISAGDFIFRMNAQYYNGSSYVTGGQIAIDASSSNLNRTVLSLSATKDGTSVDAGSAADVDLKIDGNDSGAITFNNAYKFPTSDGGANQVLQTDGSGTLTFVDQSGGLSNIVEDTTPQLGGMLDVNGNAIGDGTLELLKFSETASAVNEFTIANAATSNGPTLSATGGDTNIDINITPKGTGEVVIGAGNLNYGGTAVTSTGAELNLLDGVTGFTLDNAGDLLIVGTDGTSIDSSALLNIDTGNGRLGIGTSSPARTLHLVGDTQFEGSMRIDQYHTSDDGPDILFQKARGTPGSTTAAANGDEIMKLVGLVHDGTAFRTRVRILSDTTLSGSDYGANLQFQTGDNADPTTRMTIDENGNVTFADGTTDVDVASHDGTNGLKLGGTLVTSSATEINLLDGVSAGTVTASKAVIYDSNGGIVAGGDINLNDADDQIIHGDSSYKQKQYVLYGTTTNASETEIFIGGTSNSRIPVPTDTTVFYECDIAARRTDATGESGGWHLKAVVDNFSDTVADVGNVYEVQVASDDANFAVDVTADNTNDAIAVKVTGAASKTVRWVAIVRTFEVTE